MQALPMGAADITLFCDNEKGLTSGGNIFRIASPGLYVNPLCPLFLHGYGYTDTRSHGLMF